MSSSGPAAISFQRSAGVIKPLNNQKLNHEGHKGHEGNSKYDLNRQDAERNKINIRTAKNAKPAKKINN
jgi:hypothetical protein